MSVVKFIFCLFFVLDAYWWSLADKRLRPLNRATLWRGLLAAFMIGQGVLLLSRLLSPSWSRRINGYVPLGLIASQYLWHLGVLPVVLLGGFGRRAGVAMLRAISGEKEHVGSALADGMIPAETGSEKGEVPSAKADPTKYLNRRQLIGAAVSVAVPPVILGGVTGVSLAQLGGYRVRAFEVKVPNLPPQLEGVTIAHLSDFHAGRFMTRENMAPIIDTVNDMRPDLVLVTGDLIDYALIDLPPALDALKRLKPKYGLRDGLAMCMGNHDIIENRFAFRRHAAAAGFPILVNESRMIEVNGFPIQLMAIDWCNGDPKQKSADMMRDAVTYLAKQRKPEAFPILLAHHPHAFDTAAAMGLPLTLSGHTHGGQLMATKDFGAGSIMFRYWSGLYRKANGSQLIVSNGIGNWFPLRVNAPAEVLRLTLRTATPA